MKKNVWDTVAQLQFLPNLFPMNAYLVEEADGVTLIDACMPAMADKILKAIEETGKPLTRILLTHAHSDHIGAVPRLKAKHPAAQIGISRRDAALLKGDRSLLPGEPPSPVRGGVPKRAPFAPDFLIDDGDRMGTLVAIASPGHTPGHFAFLETTTNSLIAGDAFQTKGGIAVSGLFRPTFPFPALATWHAKTATESARRLAALKPDRLLVGHGDAIERPASLMYDAIEAAEQRFGKQAAL